MPQDGSYVPRDRLNEVLQQVRDQNATIEALRVAVGRDNNSNKSSPPQPNRAQLLAAVERGELSQDEADTLWGRQLRSEILAEARETAQREAVESSTANAIEEYKMKNPGLGDPSSPQYQRVVAEVNTLVRAGLPDNKATLLAALRGVIGAQAQQPTGERVRAEPHRDQTGGSGQGSDGGGSDSKTEEPDWFGKLSVRRKDYYRQKLSVGVYRGFDQIKDEIEDYPADRL